MDVEGPNKAMHVIHYSRYTDIADVENKEPVAVSNLKVHILTHGCSYSNGQV